MDDLISRKELLKSFDIAWMVEYDETGCGVSKRAIPVATIEAAPAIDAVPVVRCRECRHWGTGYGGETDKIKVCEWANYMVVGNGYCVYGERRCDNAAD